MNLRGVWGNAVKSISVAALFCGVLFLTFYVGAGKRGFGSGGGNRGLTAKSSPASKPATAQQTQRWTAAYGKLPMSFEENQGQTAQEVRFVSHGSGYQLFLTPQEAVLALRPNHHLDLSPLHRSANFRARLKARQAGQSQVTAVRLQFEGANPNPGISGLDRLPTRVNYFIGNDPNKWHTDVPSFAQVKYRSVYPGVDLVFYGNQRKLEYDFIVAPGADPRAIQLNIDGARSMRINRRGDLVLRVSGGEVELQKPGIYQQILGQRREIAGTFAIDRRHRVSFSVPRYDRSAPLILDPVLSYATYLGGTADDGAVAIAVDGSGDAFIAGVTTSSDFPLGAKGAFTTAPAGNLDTPFVAELDPTGANLLYFTYLAGTITASGDGAFGIALDPTGKVYVTGQTSSLNFPTTANALNPGPLAANPAGTVFLTKLDPTVNGPTSLLYSTYISGTVGEFANCVAADAAGNAYIGGQTFSTDFPTQPSQTAPSDVAVGTAFLTRIDTTKSGSLSNIFSTYLGGNGANATSLTYGEQITGVAVDSSQNAYVTGSTSSTDFATSASALLPTLPVGNTALSAFVSQINTTAGTLGYSTYLAGSNQEIGSAIALGPANIAYVTGTALSNDFPTTTNAYDMTNSSAGKAFVSLFDTTKSGKNSLTYSTFLGGLTGGGDNGLSIKADSAGIAYVAGTTTSSDFAGAGTLDALGALQTNLLNNTAPGDAFVAKLNPSVAGKPGLLYATYYGGSNGAKPDQGFGIAIDSTNPPNAYITGETSSTDLPVVSPLSAGGSLHGASDGFVAKLGLIPTLTVTPFPSFDFGTQPIGVATNAHTFTVTNNTANAATFTSVVTNGTSPAANTDFAVSTDGCSPSVAAGLTCNIGVKFTPSVAAPESANLVITATLTNGGQNATIVLTVNLTGTGSASAPAVGLSTNTLTFNPQMVTTTSAAMPVTLTNTGTGPLTINSIAASGDFAATSTGATACPISPNTLPATAGSNTCTINVTITPTATGARAGTLTITDNANGSPHTVTLNGTGWDFTVTGPTGTQTGTSPLMFNATLTSLGGFSQSVAFTCTGAPTGATCTVASPITGNPNPQPVQVTITRTSGGLMGPPAPMRIPPMSIWQIALLLMALVLLILLPRVSRLRVRLGIIATMVLLLTVAGCSGPKPPVQPLSGNVTIKGTSSGSAGSVSHSAQVAFTLN